MLAIVSPGFHEPTETFIRHHVKYVAPGRTVLVCNDPLNAANLACPFLSNVEVDYWRPYRSPFERVAMSLRSRVGRRITLGLIDQRRILEFFAKHRVRAVLAEYGLTGVLISDTCNIANVPLFVHFHGYDASILIKDPKWVRRYQALFQKTAGIIAPSRFLAGGLARIGCEEEKLHVCACGVDPACFQAGNRGPLRVLAASTLSEKKAPLITIQAFAAVIGRGLDAELDIVGDGPLMGVCRNLVEALRLESHVRFHGWQPPEAVARLMGESSLFVQHSVTTKNGDTEGLPVAILEAMASGLPVVSTRHSGIPEAVVHGKTGLLTEEFDVRAMTDAICTILLRPDAGIRMGADGRKRVLEHFTLERTTQRLRDILAINELVE